SVVGSFVEAIADRRTTRKTATGGQVDEPQQRVIQSDVRPAWRWILLRDWKLEPQVDDANAGQAAAAAASRGQLGGQAPRRARCSMCEPIFGSKLTEDLWSYPPSRSEAFHVLLM